MLSFLDETTIAILKCYHVTPPLTSESVTSAGTDAIKIITHFHAGAKIKVGSLLEGHDVLMTLARVNIFLFVFKGH